METASKEVDHDEDTSFIVLSPRTGTLRGGIHAECQVKTTVDSLVQNDPSVTEVSIKGASLNNMAFGGLLSSLHSNSHVTSLQLIKIRGVESVFFANSVAETIRQNTTIKSLCIRENALGNDSSQLILNGLSENLTIVKIDFDDELKPKSDSVSLRRVFLSNNKYNSNKTATMKKMQIVASINDHFQKAILKKPTSVIELQNHGLTSYPRQLDALAQEISFLKLSQNRISVLPDDHILILVNLSTIDVSHNRLTALPDDIGLLENLRIINARSNKLTSLPTSIGVLRVLSQLILSDNRLTQIPRVLATMKSLMVVDFENNPIKGVPKDILSNTSQLLPYLRNLSQGSELLYRMKIMFVGAGNVGKTTLRKKLKQLRSIKLNKSATKKRVDKEDDNDNFSNVATDGIDISTWTVEVETEKGTRNVSFSMWDFAGQELYYSTHQFFLTRRSIYVIVFDLTKTSSQWNLEYWIQSICSRTKNSTIFLVGTHVENKQICTEQFLNKLHAQFQEDFSESFPNVKSVHFVSLLTGEGVDFLMQDIVQWAMKDESMGEEVPKTYLTLEQKVKSLSKFKFPPIISFEEFQKEAHAIGVERADAIGATSFLHDLGVLVYFKEEDQTGLSQVIIMDPQWLTQVLSSIVSLKNFWIENGMLSALNLKQVWRPPEFPSEIHPTLITLLEKFELIYEMPRVSNLSLSGNIDIEEVYLVPCMLTGEVPADADIKWSHYEARKEKRIFIFKFLPIGLMSRLLTRSLRIAKLESAWKNGFLISLNGERAFVESDEARRQISVECVDGGRPSRLMKILMDNINNLAKVLLKRDNRIEKILLPCPHCVEKGFKTLFWFTLKDCEGVAAAGRGFLYCNFEKPIRVNEIAPDIFINYNEIDYDSIVIEKLIGEGGFSSVYRGRLPSGEVVAIKKLNAESRIWSKRATAKLRSKEVEDHLKDKTSRDSLEVEALEAFALFRNEIMTMSGLNHPNLVALLGICVSPQPCIITEFLEYGDLNNLLNNPSIQVSYELKKKIALDIASGMNFLHSAIPPIMHRDLKSPNVLLASLSLDANVVAKISDFGTSVQLSDSSGREVDNPFWLAPEIILGDQYTTQSDVYSFGIILWELITQQAPFSEYNEKFLSILEDKIVSGLRPTLPTDPQYANFVSLIERCWDGDQAIRPTFDQIVEHLTDRTPLEPRSPANSPPQTPDRQRRLTMIPNFPMRRPSMAFPSNAPPPAFQSPVTPRSAPTTPLTPRDDPWEKMSPRSTSRDRGMSITAPMFVPIKGKPVSPPQSPGRQPSPMTIVVSPRSIKAMNILGMEPGDVEIKKDRRRPHANTTDGTEEPKLGSHGLRQPTKLSISTSQDHPTSPRSNTSPPPVTTRTPFVVAVVPSNARRYTTTATTPPLLVSPGSSPAVTSPVSQRRQQFALGNRSAPPAPPSKQSVLATTLDMGTFAQTGSVFSLSSHRTISTPPTLTNSPILIPSTNQPQNESNNRERTSSQLTKVSRGSFSERSFSTSNLRGSSIIMGSSLSASSSNSGELSKRLKGVELQVLLEGSSFCVLGSEEQAEIWANVNVDELILNLYKSKTTKTPFMTVPLRGALICSGFMTPGFLSRGKAGRERFALSIISSTNDAILDLEAETEETQELWVRGLQNLVGKSSYRGSTEEKSPKS